jgi:hypothetical protein
MKLSGIVLAMLALGTGLAASYKWYKASRVEIDLGYNPIGVQGGIVKRMGLEFPRSSEPLDPEGRQGNEIIATWEAMNEAAKLNKEAAIWTAGSVALGALSAIVGASG